MHKTYLSIIALLVLALTFVWTSSNDDSTIDEKQNDSASESTNEKNMDKPNISINSFEEYFSGVTPKEGLFENRKGAVIDLEEVPEGENKQYAAGLLLEAKKAMNSEREIGIPTLNNLDSFFSPTDHQLNVLQEDSGSKLATRIKHSSLQVKQASELVDNEELSKQLKVLGREFIEIEPYKQETLYDFSLALNEYKHNIKQVIRITNTFNRN